MSTMARPRRREGDGPSAPVRDFELLESKLRPPWSRSGLLRRAALIDRIERSEAPIVTVVAPAGYGKTTLLAQWSAGPRTGWVSLDDHDNDPSGLVRYVAAALDRVEPIDDATLRALTSPGTVQPGELARRLAMVVARRDSPFTLVFDHAEVITEPTCRDILTELALSLPPGARLAIASRAQPPLPMSVLRAQGRTIELTAADLALDDEEATAVATGAGAVIDQAQLADLMRRTEGWPVGIYLGAMALKAGRSATLQQGGLHDEAALNDFVRTEVIDSLSPAALLVLTRTSILEELSAGLCDAVAGTAGAQAVLEGLAASNNLIAPLDARRRWYRCHRLLREVLHDELARREPDMIPRLHDRAATWLEANGHADIAIDHAQAAGDVERATRLFGRWAQLTFAAGRVDTALRWLAWFDERGLVEDNPELAVLGALSEALLGHVAGTEHWADAAESASGATMAPDGSPMASWIAYLSASLCRHGPAQMRSDAERARAGLNPHSPLVPPAQFAEAMSYVLAGDDDTADDLLIRAVENNLRRKTFPTAVMATGERAVIAINRGDWASAEEFAGEAVSIVDEAHLESYLVATLAYAVAARTAAHRGDLAAARQHTVRASRLRPLCSAAFPLSAQFLMQLAMAYMETADAPGSRAVLRQVRDILHARPDLGVVADQAAELERRLEALPVGDVGVSSVTAAELRLVPLLATHLSYREIGERIYVSRNTVKSQAASLFRKLGASSRGEAVAKAEGIGLLGR